MKRVRFILGMVCAYLSASAQQSFSTWKEDSSRCITDMSKQVVSTPYTVVYDFKTGNIAYPSKYHTIGRGDIIKIKITNFNRFLYQVIINGKDSTNRATIDSSNLFGSFTSISNLSSLVSNLTEKVTAVIKKVDESTTDNDTTMRQQQQKAPDATQLKTLLTEHSVIIRKSNQSVYLLKDKTDSLTTFGWPQLMKVTRKPYPTANDFNSINNDALRYSFLQSFSNLKREIRQSINDIRRTQYNYLDSTAYFTALLKQDTIKEIDSLIKSYYTKTLASLIAVDSTLSYKKLQTAVEQIETMQGAQSYFLSEPLLLRGDTKIINLKITPWNPGTRFLPPEQSITFELPKTPQRICGVTGGIYISTLHNENYSTRFDSISATKKGYRLIKENNGTLEFGLNVLAYYDWKLRNNDKNYWYGGVAFGAGSSIESSPKPRFFIGGNLANGITNRLLITTGLSGGYVSRLSAAYNQNAFYNTAPGDCCIDLFRVGAFLSVSYSFINK